MSLFESVKRAECHANQNPLPPNGSLDVDTELRAAISLDLKHAKNPCGRDISRYEVAARMSELVGREITASMLNNWTAESHEKHSFPCQVLPSFVIATGGQRRSFDVLSHKAGLFALPGREALRAEIEQIEEEIRRLREEKLKRRVFLKEVEK